MNLSAFLVVYLSLLPWVTCERTPRLVIDKKSCAGDVYTHVESAVNNTLKWAKEAAEEMGRPEGEMNTLIAEKESWIFGDLSTNKRNNIQKNFQHIASIKLTKADVYADPWKKNQGAADVVVTCNADHIKHMPTDDFPDYPYKDVLRDMYMSGKNLAIDFKEGKSPDFAMFTSPPNDKAPHNKGLKKMNKADVIVINPLTVEGEQADGWQNITLARIEKSANPDLQEKVAAKLQTFRDEFAARFKRKDKRIETSFDLLDSFEGALFHEYTHLRVAHESEDAPKGKCYGWNNVLKCRNDKNADSLRLFAQSIQLILHYGYDVSKEGKLKKIKVAGTN